MLQTSGEAGDGKETLSMQSPSPMRPATKRKRVAFNVGNQVSPAAAVTSATTTTMTASGTTMTSVSRTGSLSDLLAFNPHSRAAPNNNNSGTKHKLYNPVVTPDFL